MSVRRLCLALLVFPAGTLEAAAQSADRLAECRQVLVSQIGRDSAQAEALPRPCGILSLDLVNELEPSIFEDEVEIAPRDLHPAVEGSSDPAGSPAQSDPVASVQPMALGGGSVAATGSEAGSDAITSLTFTPAVFFGSTEASPALARNSRLADITVFFPVDELDKDEDGDVDYFGIRLRLNANGISAGREIWTVADSLQGMVRASNEVANILSAELVRVPPGQLDACVRLIRDSGSTAADVARTCGSDVRPTFRLDYDDFRSQLAAIRQKADSWYWGLDVRMDFGDPTLGAVPDADATSLGFAFAAGRQLAAGSDDPLAPSLAVRVRAGVRHTSLRSVSESDAGVEGGFGFVARRPVTPDQAITISSGVEFRRGNVAEAMKAALQSDFLMFKAAMSVPLTGQAALTVAFAQPLMGKDYMSQQLSVTGNWKLLLPGLGPLGGT